MTIQRTAHEDWCQESRFRPDIGDTHMPKVGDKLTMRLLQYYKLFAVLFWYFVFSLGLYFFNVY